MTEHPKATPNRISPPPPSAAGLAGMGTTIQLALVLLGLFDCVDAMLVGARSPLAAIVRLGAFLLSSWVLPRLLRAGETGLALFRQQVESLDLLAATAARLAEAMEQSPTLAGTFLRPAIPPIPPAPVGADEAKTLAMAAIGEAIRQGHWALAESLIPDFAESYPDDRLVDRLADELAKARQSSAESLRARIEAAREANEPGLVLEALESLSPLLTPEARRELGRNLARWFMGQIQKRLRGGLISPDVVTLAGRVADHFPTTPEGLSLRAALPTLRRSVGLCARCGQPYHGLADACPACLAAIGSPSVPNPLLSPSNDALMHPATSIVDEEIDPELN